MLYPRFSSISKVFVVVLQRPAVVILRSFNIRHNEPYTSLYFDLINVPLKCLCCRLVAPKQLMQ